MWIDGIMILCDKEILAAIRSRKIIINPPPKVEQYAPSALDLRTGSEFRRWKKQPKGAQLSFDLSNLEMSSYGAYTEEIPLHGGRFTLEPNEFVLAKTLEVVSLPYSGKIAARIEGRSGCARLGLVVHMTAPTIHCGFSGTITLEMMNFGQYPLIIEPSKTCICQLILERLRQTPAGQFNSAFQNQRNVLGRS